MSHPLSLLPIVLFRIFFGKRKILLSPKEEAIRTKKDEKKQKRVQSSKIAKKNGRRLLFVSNPSWKKELKTKNATQSEEFSIRTTSDFFSFWKGKQR